MSNHAIMQSSNPAIPGTLYVVSTPIGNLEDISLRALRILRESALVAAEDTRITRKLLSHYDIHTPLTSYHQHTSENKLESLASSLADGKNIALVCDAGTPGVSDPGGEIIARAIRMGAPVVPIPGPSAALAALAVSGLPSGRFTFEGFPPRTRSDRREFFARLRSESRTLILYESPARLVATLEELHAEVGNRPVSVGRELTKLFEEVFRGTISGAVEHFGESRPRGEFTIVIGPPSQRPESNVPSQDDIEAALRESLGSGNSSRDAVRDVSARLHMSRRLVYQHLLAVRSDE